MKLPVRRLHPQAKLPCYSHNGDAGLDLFSMEEATLEPGRIRAIATGIQAAVPDGHAGLIWDKSGLSLKGIHCLAGVVDSGYRGEIRVVLVNLGDDPWTVTPGMKIAQLLVQPVVSVEISEVAELDDTSRGDNGFGSTGLY